jgi:hypothetical protein
MKKRIFLMLILLISLMLPNKNAFAASSSLVDGKSFTLSSDPLAIGFNFNVIGTTLDITNGNLSTNGYSFYRRGLSNTFANSAFYQFNDPVTVDSFTTYIQDGSNYFSVRLYDSNKNLLGDYKPSSISGAKFTLPAPVSGVSYILVYNNLTSTNKSLTELQVFGQPSVIHDDLTGLSANTTYNSVSLIWDSIVNSSLTGYKIYRDGVLIGNVDSSSNTFLDTGLKYSTNYSYKVTANYDDGFETNGVVNAFSTSEDPVVKKVANANAKAVSYKQINVSWDLPNQNGFHHVNIYRAVKPNEQGFFEWLLGSIASADTTPTEIFETNGTYFNDLTVKPDTNYEYTLTTETTDGRVSDEVTVTADTPEEPTPVLKTDGDYTVNQDGSYAFKWTEPTLGKVKILIDGKDYKLVDASLKQITIPKSDMKKNTWGDPSVSMIPVGEFGTEGKEVFIGDNSFLKSLKLPIKSSDLLTTSMGILGLVAPIILLVLVIYYFKSIKRLIESTALKIKKRGVKT